jgi:hypothetical protein
VERGIQWESNENEEESAPRRRFSIHFTPPPLLPPLYPPHLLRRLPCSLVLHGELCPCIHRGGVVGVPVG